MGMHEHPHDGALVDAHESLVPDYYHPALLPALLALPALLPSGCEG